MKKSFLLGLLVLFTLTGASCANATFYKGGKIKWDKNIPSTRHMKLASEIGDIKYYKKLDERLHIGEVTLSEVLYAFRGEKWEGVQLSARGQRNAQALANALRTSHGEPDGNTSNACYWSLSRAHLSYEYNPYSQTALAVYRPE